MSSWQPQYHRTLYKLYQSISVPKITFYQHKSVQAYRFPDVPYVLVPSLPSTSLPMLLVSSALCSQLWQYIRTLSQNTLSLFLFPFLLTYRPPSLPLLLPTPHPSSHCPSSLSLHVKRLLDNFTHQKIFNLLKKKHERSSKQTINSRKNVKNQLTKSHVYVHVKLSMSRWLKRETVV